ncbi:deoxyuridine 5'-triphosphate nucleotidohydrolase [Euwallacea similis]|uniref:deoxyuridine 5'-triphosphate nucleotidohydrolase n=1 Tax=Euwallacea similis TaxID=1736056 RepID=UPI00344F3FF2
MPSPLDNPLVLKYTKVIPEAFPPTKGSEKAAGYDLKSAVNVVVPARGKYLVDTGLKIELPEGCYGRIAPRSGLAVKNFIDVGAGVVDEDYRGVLKVVLFNHSDTNFEVKKGDRVAQLICEKIYYPQLEEVEELTQTQRGEGGFGSTGTN